MRLKSRSKVLMRNFIIFFFLWVVLTEGDTFQIWLGLSFSLLAATSALWLANPPEPRTKFRLRAFLGYLVYFIYHSLTGGIDVARRAFRLSRNVRPIYVKYSLRIPPTSENARTVFATSICLFPGSLSCAFRENVLIIQMLDEEIANLESIAKLEELVAALFSIPLKTLARNMEKSL